MSGTFFRVVLKGNQWEMSGKGLGNDWATSGT